MADALGFLSKMGISVRTSWTQAYTAPTYIMPFLSETLTSQFNRIPNDTLQGYGGRLPSEQGVEGLGGSTEHHFSYNTSGPRLFLTAVMGLDTAGVITITDTVTDKYYVIELEKQVKRWRFWPCACNKMTITGEKDKPCKIVFDWFARNFDAVDTAFPSLAQPSNTLVMFDDLVFRVADQIDAIAAGDSVGIDSFEIVLDRARKADDYESNATTPKQPLDPVSGGWRVSTLKIKVPRYSTGTFEGWRDANTALQADLTFTGPVVTITIQLPELRVTDGFNQPIGGPAPLTVEGTFEAYRSVTGNPMYVGNEMKVTYV